VYALARPFEGAMHMVRITGALIFSALHLPKRYLFCLLLNLLVIILKLLPNGLKVLASYSNSSRKRLVSFGQIIKHCPLKSVDQKFDRNSKSLDQYCTRREHVSALQLQVH
jgi:hypothetical protein